LTGFFIGAQQRSFYQQRYCLVFSFWLILALFDLFVWRNRALLAAKFVAGYGTWVIFNHQPSASSQFGLINFFLSKVVKFAKSILLFPATRALLKLIVSG
jgi:hypothetical protein